MLVPVLKRIGIHKLQRELDPGSEKSEATHFSSLQLCIRQSLLGLLLWDNFGFIQRQLASKIDWPFLEYLALFGDSSHVLFNWCLEFLNILLKSIIRLF